MVQIVDFSSHKISFNPLGLSSNQEQIQLRTMANPYFMLRLAPRPLFRVSSQHPLLHPPTNCFWYRIGTEQDLTIVGVTCHS